VSIEAPIPEAALAAIKAPFQDAGAQAVEPAVLQPLGLLLDLAGEALRERLFVIQADGGEERCLRPDFTIPAVRAHIASGRAGGRYVYDGSVFLVSRAGSGEPEEVRQIGLEAFQAGDAPADDAEIAALAWRACVAGGRTDLSLRFGDVGLFAAFIDALALAEPLAARLKRAFAQPRRLRAELDAAGRPVSGAPQRRLESLLVTLPEADAAQVLEELWTLAAIQPVGGRPASEIVHRLAERARGARAPALTLDQAALIDRYLAISAPPAQALEQVFRLVGGTGRTLDAALKGWERRLEALSSEGVPAQALTLATAFSRPFGYYDGVFFEVVSAGLGPDAALAAGGRYDGLPARLASPRATGAVGCMVRPARAWAGGAA
jgi:ATP phosphoribosyltransferase regulatory subunit